MKRMLLLTAALIAALAGPALAQDRRDSDRGSERGQMQRGGGEFRGGDRGQRNFGQRDQADRPSFNSQQGFNRGGDANRFSQQNNAPREFNRGGFNRDGDGNRFSRQNNAPRDFNRGGDNRFGERNFDRGGNRFDGNRNDLRRDNDRRDFGRFDGRRDNNWYGRNDYRNGRYSQYYRSFNSQRRFRADRYYWPSGYSYRRWSYGDFLPSLYWGSRYWLNNYYSYDLTPPMPGTVWVRYGDDALLIDQYTGEVIQVAYGIFW